VLIVIPVLQKEMPLLQAQIPAFLAKAQRAAGALRLHEMASRSSWTAPASSELASEADGRQRRRDLDRRAGNSARVGGTAVLGWIATLVLIPVVLFYLLLDWHQMLARIAGCVPRRWIGATMGMARKRSTCCWPSTCAASCW
jgi:predicted PurR-regulated permease PerM